MIIIQLHNNFIFIMEIQSYHWKDKEYWRGRKRQHYRHCICWLGDGKLSWNILIYYIYIYSLSIECKIDNLVNLKTFKGQLNVKLSTNDKWQGFKNIINPIYSELNLFYWDSHTISIQDAISLIFFTRSWLKVQEGEGSNFFSYKKIWILNITLGNLNVSPQDIVSLTI